ncbi:MAG: hypothetical protein HY868_06470 [Chloroflexi bacterium]|nr:hypothetical protein [Chloroflexota bacterium]
MKRTLALIALVGVILVVIVMSALVLLSTRASPLPARAALPTAVPGLSSKDPNYATPISKRTRSVETVGATSTPAPFATRLPPTPLPPPVAVPHSLVGKADCLYCHKGNTYFSVPKDHARRTNEMCLGCHPLSASAPRPTARPAAHSADGHENCLICHLQGGSGARPVPGDHAGRTNDTCRACHRLK